MYDKRSDFAKNKGDPQAIVYISVTGETFRLVCSDFENEKQFSHWKAWSDDDYKKVEAASRWYNDCAVPIREEVDTDGISVENIIIPEKMSMSRKQLLSIVIGKIKDVLTETQYRRLWMHYGERMPMIVIALSEGVSEPAISKSIQGAIKKLRKILKKRL